MVLFIVLALCVLFGVISGAVASSRGHNFVPFFILGAVISPLLAIILAFVISPPRRAKKKRRGRMVRRKLPLYARGKPALREDRNPYKAPTASYSRR
jgi:hypothetical protein